MEPEGLRVFRESPYKQVTIGQSLHPSVVHASTRCESRQHVGTAAAGQCRAVLRCVSAGGEDMQVTIRPANRSRSRGRGPELSGSHSFLRLRGLRASSEGKGSEVEGSRGLVAHPGVHTGPQAPGHSWVTYPDGNQNNSIAIAALFAIAKTWKQPKCPSTDEWIKKMWSIYTMEYYSAIKRMK